MWLMISLYAADARSWGSVAVADPGRDLQQKGAFIAIYEHVGNAQNNTGAECDSQALEGGSRCLSYGCC